MRLRPMSTIIIIVKCKVDCGVVSAKNNCKKNIQNKKRLETNT